MIPTGSSYGANTTLASVSHSETKPAPNKAHRGNRCFDSDVDILLTAWGTKSPTKESRPQTLTAARSEKNSYVGVKASVASVRFVWRGLRFTM